MSRKLIEIIKIDFPNAFKDMKQSAITKHKNMIKLKTEMKLLYKLRE